MLKDVDKPEEVISIGALERVIDAQQLPFDIVSSQTAGTINASHRYSAKLKQMLDEEEEIHFYRTTGYTKRRSTAALMPQQSLTTRLSKKAMASLETQRCSSSGRSARPATDEPASAAAACTPGRQV